MENLVIGKISFIRLIHATSQCGIKKAKDAAEWAWEQGTDVGASDEYILLAGLFIAKDDGIGAMEACVKTGNVWFGHVALKILRNPLF